MNDDTTDDAIFIEGYTQSMALLHKCSSTDGFLASLSERDNYRRVWARDGVILGLAALMSGDLELVHRVNNHQYSARSVSIHFG
ncbi:hypothetical protein SH528x_004986 [Novipirellula sp. SH528]|uniref:hypothetical protein n=1 Tax=Novipirellula sp. SH528 TaxID=3454466 RepID=UPI003F9FF20B